MTDKASPWTIIGWIVLICFLLTLAFCARVAYNVAKTDAQFIESANNVQVPAQIPLYAKKISMECTEDKIEVTVRNTGTEAIRFAKGFLQSHDKSGKVIEVKNSYFHPNDIPPGSVSSVDVYLDRGGHSSCSLLEMQDTHGTIVNVSE
jgi:hypothetical protein